MKEITEQCIESIVRYTKYPYRLIIVDNASGDETKQYLESLRSRKDVEIILIRNEENIGYSKAANQGIRASDAEYVCILNNDIIVMDNWLAEMAGIAEKEPAIGIVNPLSNYGARRPFGKSWEAIAIERYERGKGDYIETAAAIGFCFLIKREVINKIGIFSEAYGPGYFEDTEYSIRAVRNGYKIAIAQGSYVVHLEHSSFKKSGAFKELFTKNQELFLAEFGRSKRFLYIIAYGVRPGLNREAYQSVQSRNWIWAFVRKGVNMEMPRHAYIRIFRLNRLFFIFNCVARILIRKKKFDIIYSDSPSLRRVLKALRIFHRADVLTEEKPLFDSQPKREIEVEDNSSENYLKSYLRR